MHARPHTHIQTTTRTHHHTHKPTYTQSQIFLLTSRHARIQTYKKPPAHTHTHTNPITNIPVHIQARDTGSTTPVETSVYVAIEDVNDNSPTIMVVSVASDVGEDEMNQAEVGGCGVWGYMG